MSMTLEENFVAILSCNFTMRMKLILLENGEKHTSFLTLLQISNRLIISNHLAAVYCP